MKFWRNLKFSNALLYIAAAVFLGYHLMPFIIGVKSSITSLVETQTKNQEKAIQCQDVSFNVLTYGNPLTDPLYVSLTNRTRLIEPKVTGENVLVNPSFARASTESSATPFAWKADTWGKNSAILSYPVPGADATPGVRAEITSYESGDAKWLSAPVAVQGSDYFQFSSMYKSNADTSLLLVYTFADNSQQYITYGTLPATDRTAPNDNKNWKQYSADFVVPANARSVQVAHYIDRIGYIQADNYKLIRQPLANFQRGLVTVTFDDGYRTVYEKALPLLRKYSIPTTQYVVPGLFGSPDYMTVKQIATMQAEGHEIGSHSMNHSDLSTRDISRIDAESRNSFFELTKQFGEVRNFATPYGRYSGNTKQVISQCYTSLRNTETGFNTRNYDRYNLRVLNVEANTPEQEVTNAIRFARDNKLWLILVYHGVDDNQGEYTLPSSQLEKHFQAIRESKIQVVTMQQGLAETMPQKDRF